MRIKWLRLLTIVVFTVLLSILFIAVYVASNRGYSGLTPIDVSQFPSIRKGASS